MKNKSSIALNKEIRSLIRELGWVATTTYTDHRAYGRRVKFMENGYNPSDEVKAKVQAGIEALLKKKGLGDTHTLSWHYGMSIRGQYPYLVMQVKE